jgi:hypothetical protein
VDRRVLERVLTVAERHRLSSGQPLGAEAADAVARAKAALARDDSK